MNEVTAAIGAVKALVGMAKLAVEARDDAKIKDALIQINEKLFDVTSGSLAMAEKAAALQSELEATRKEARELREAADEASRYFLHQVRPGGFVRALQPAHGEKPSEPYWCQPCFDAGTRSTFVRSLGEGRVLQCSINRAHNISLWAQQLPQRRATSWDPYA